jgi:DUF917 family protein
MAKLFISEFIGDAAVARDPNGSHTVFKLPPVAEQVKTFTASAANCNALNAATTMIRVTADAHCAIKIGGAATVDSLPVWANSYQEFAVDPGAVISVIAL